MLADLYLNAALLISHIFMIHKLYDGIKGRKWLAGKGSLFFGIAYGVLGILLMLFSIQLKGGVVLDLRPLPTILAVVQGGPAAAIISSLIIAAGRIGLFPFNNTAIISGIIAVTGGIGCALIAKYIRWNGWRLWCLLIGFCVFKVSLTIALVSPAAELTLQTILHFIVFLCVTGGISYLLCEYFSRGTTALERLELLSRTDALTGLLNFHGLHLELRQLEHQSAPWNLRFRMYLLDCKNVRMLNVNMGQRKVNELLQKAAEGLQLYFPGAYAIARYHGDKFLLVVDDQEPEAARNILEVLLPAYTGLSFEYASIECCSSGLKEQRYVASLEDQLAGRKNMQWHQQEQQLQRNERLKTVGELAAGLAHEIRNPLTSVKGFLQLSRQQNNFEKFYPIIVEEVDRMNELTKEFLQFSKPKDADMVRTSLRDCVVRAVQLTESQALRLGHRVMMEAPEETIDVMGDAQKLVRVLLNLMKNGLEAMPSSGVLRVALQLKQGEPAAAVVRVTDTGCGIPAGQLERIFHPFFSTKEAGTGLGLSICQKIIQDHHGTLKVESAVGQGTTFVVELPCALQV